MLSDLYSMSAILLIATLVVGWTFLPFSMYGEAIFALFMLTMIFGTLENKRRDKVKNKPICAFCRGHGSSFISTGYDVERCQVIGYMQRCDQCNGTGTPVWWSERDAAEEAARTST